MSHSTVAEDSGIQIPDALLERMMERKLQVLEREYQECLSAKRHDDGLSTDEQAQVAASHGYARMGTGVGLDTRGQLLTNEDDQDEEFSEAWTEFQSSCKKEELELEQGEGDATDSKPSVFATLPPITPLAKPPTELTKEKITTIKGVMADIKLKPPMWALNIPEEVWMSQILQRAGYQASQPTSTTSLSELEFAALAQPQLLAMTQPTSFQSSTQSNNQHAHKKKKNKKKVKKVRGCEEDRELQQCEPLVAHAEDDGEDFVPSFPPAVDIHSNTAPTRLHEPQQDQTGTTVN